MDSEWVESFYPLFAGTGTVDLTFKAANTPGQVIDFDVNDVDTKSFEFNIADQYKIDPNLNTRFFNMRIQSTNNETWKLGGYDLTTLQPVDGK